MRHLACLIGLVLALLGHAADLRAHAVLLGTEPAQGARLTAAPPRLALRFSEPVVPIDLQILANGERLVVPAPAARGGDVLVELPAVLEDGSYLVSYRVRSADTHPIGGSFAFTIGEAAGASAPPPAHAHDRFWTMTALVVRALLYGGLLLVAGGRLLTVTVQVPSRITDLMSGPLRVTAWASLGLVALFAGVSGGGLVGGPPAILLTARPWMVALDSPIGASLAAAAAGLLLLLWEDGRRSAVVRAIAAALVALSFALSGHAVTAASRWITLPAIWLHTLGAAFWLGALWPLHLALRHLDTARAAPLIETFSRRASLAVGALLLAGLLLASLQLTSPADLIDTGYGQRLGLKILAVTGLLAVAALNRFHLTPGLRTGAAGRSAQGLCRTVAADMVLMALVIALTASLSLDAPPRALTGHMAGRGPQPAGQTLETTLRKHTLGVTVAPAVIGANSLTLRLLVPQGRPLSAEKLEIRLALPEKGIEPMRVAATREDDGSYTAAGFFLPVAGAWELRVDVLVDDFTKLIFRTELQIGEAHRH
ncbi:FixH family protein [Geminicoccaceae bacterium 1502E]|nr:FixH family protein [Geminicoccaceae bacterium 1502E]